MSKITNVRDFCFWMRGVLDASQGAPTLEQWDLIVEHATSLKDKTISRDPCSELVMMIWGFVQVAGDDYPTDTQWTMILEKTYDYLDRVPDYDSRSFKDDLEHIAKEAAKRWPPDTGRLPPDTGPQRGGVLLSSDTNWVGGDQGTPINFSMSGEEVGELIAQQC